MIRLAPCVTHSFTLAILLRGACAQMPEGAYASDAVQQYDPALTRAFASLTSLSYCAAVWPSCQPPGLVKAVENNCGDVNGSWCRAAGFSAVPGRVKTVMLPDLGQECQLFAIVAKWRRLKGSAASSKVPKEEGCFIAIRGSVGMPVPRETADPNWIRDYDTGLIEPTEWPDCEGCKVFAGHYKIWLAMKNATLSTLKDVGCTAEDKSPVYVTGHSLGGSVGYQAMYALKTLGFDVQTSYLFGSRMPGNSYFATAFSKLMGNAVPAYSVTHATDSVSRYPGLAPGYQVIPYEVHYPYGSTNYTVCYDPTDAKCGIFSVTRAELLSPVKDPKGMKGDHCVFPEAPYGNFCQFASMFGIIYFLGAPGLDAKESVCHYGNIMPYSAPGKADVVLV